jgi:hypothetical protein
MRKLIVLAIMAVAFAALMAPSASATVHPLVCSENSSAPASTPAKTQNPPGITTSATDPDPDNNVEARPVVAILSNSTTNDLNAFKPEGC